MQLDIQAIGKVLNQIISVLGISCLKDKNKFYSAVADFLLGCSFEVERNILCACICSEVSGSLIEAASKSQNEKQLAFNNCIQYLIDPQKLTEQQANELVKVFTLALWGEDKQVVDSKCSVTKEQEFDDIFAYLREVAEQGDIKVQFELGRFYYNGVNRDYTEAVKWYRQAAEQGNANAQCMLGDCYYNGNGVNRDYAEAVKWYRKAAEQGNADAQFQLGDCYYWGNGVDEDYAEAEKWCRKAAEQGNAEAQCRLGNCYYLGFGVNEDPEEAIKWYRKAAEQGNAEVQCQLGDSYGGFEILFNNKLALHSVEVPPPVPCPFCHTDYAEAVKWYRKAAEQGDDKAQFMLGSFYYLGFGVNEDPEEAIKWYRKAAEQGYTRAQYKLGDCYCLGFGVNEDPEEAAKWYRKAAEQGYTGAQYKLGDCYYLGFGVNEDPEEAIKWYEKAAEKGNSDAQCMLGFCYYYGSGAVADVAVVHFAYILNNYNKAVKWFRRAAEQGNAYAQYMLGECHCFSDGVSYSLSYEEGVKWYKKAAEQGDVGAKYMLGFCYSDGRGVKTDEAEADKWYRKAAELGSGKAIDALRHDRFGGWCNDVSQYSCNSNRVYFSRMNWANLSLLEKAAEQGNAAAQYMLGELHYFGNEAGRSYYEHMEESKLYYQAAKQGHTFAMYKLGCLFKHVNDYANAVKWYRQAAEEYNYPAIVALADCYCDGRGVSKDYAKAKELYDRVDDSNPQISFYTWCFGSVASFYKSRCEDKNIKDENIKKAIKYYYLAAKVGDGFCRSGLGSIGLGFLV